MPAWRAFSVDVGPGAHSLRRRLWNAGCARLVLCSKYYFTKSFTAVPSCPDGATRFFFLVLLPMPGMLPPGVARKNDRKPLGR
jgi:hypothetical protein